MQAIILAAGMGKRLHKEHLNKCMVEVNGKSLWDYMVCALKKAGIFKVIIVTGYREVELKKFILSNSPEMEVFFVDNFEYASTNNIWSFYLAHPFFTEDTILLESDLIFEDNTILQLCESEHENIAVVAKYESWMDGTTVQLQEGSVKRIIPKSEMQNYDLSDLYKTVNIYKFSRGFLQDKYLPALKEFITKNGKNEYYEMVLKGIVDNSSGLLFGLLLERKWYEIDTIEDLENAQKIFKGVI